MICQPDWKLLEDGKEINGIEHAGLHLCCKKIAQNDKNKLESQEYTFGNAILENLTDEIVNNITFIFNYINFKKLSTKLIFLD